MKRPTRWLLAMCLMWISAPAQQNDQDTITTIRALEHAWTDAQSRNDNGSLNLIFDNDLVYVEYGRLVSKGDYLSRVKHEVPTQNSVVCEALIVRPLGHTALVIGSYREKQLKGSQRSVKRWRFIDTWVYKNHTWLLVAAAATPITN